MDVLTRTDFTGGFTDDLFDQNPTKCFANDNLLLDNDDRLVTRWGSQILSGSPQPSGSATRVGRFMMVDHGGPSSPSRYAYAVIGRSLYYGSVSDTTNKTSSLSPLKADFISQAFVFTPTNVPWSHWDGVLYFGGGSNKNPFKYIPGISSSGPVTAGLPDVPDTANYVSATVVASASTLAQAIRSAMNTHFADTAQHISADTVAAALLPAGAPATLATLITYTTSLIAAYQAHFIDQRTISLYHRKETATSTIPQVSLASQTLLSTVAPTTIEEVVDRLHDLKTAYNSHFGNVDIHTNTSGGSAVVSSAFLTGVTSGPTISQNLQALYDFANRLKTKFNAHLADGGAVGKAHSTAADGVNTVAAANATTLDSLGTLIYALRVGYNEHEKDAELGAAWAYHVAQEASDHSLSRRMPTSTPPYGDSNYGLYPGPKTLGEMVAALNELKLKYNAHVEDWTTHYTTNPTYEAQALAGPDISLGQYVYAFVWKRSFSHNSYKTSEDIGAPLLKTATDVVAVEYSPISLSNLPVFANTTAVSDWITDTTLKLQIYRTSSGGTDFFLVGEVPNGTTTFTDNVSDEVLVTNEALYTNGGEADNNFPPVCSAMHINDNGYGYYGNTATMNISTGTISEYAPNRVYQSKAGDPDSVPSDFYEDLSSPVVAISSVRGVTVVLCKRQIVRLDGVIDDLGRGSMSPVVIAKTLGCVSEASVIQIEGGIIFAGTDGFYWTDGYQVQILSDDWRTTYQSMTDTPTKCERMMAAYDQDNRMVFMGVQRQSASSDNDGWLCLHLDKGIKPDALWTTASNGTIFGTTALLSTGQGELLRGDRQGYCFYHQESYLTDPYVLAGQTPSTWGTAPILPDYQTCQLDLGSRDQRKWTPILVTEHKALTALNLGINVNADDGRVVAQLTGIDRDLVAFTAPTDTSFGTPANPVVTAGKYIEKRHFPATSLRSTTKALQFTGSFIQLRDSVTDGDGTATISGSTATLTNGAKSWPTDCVGQYLLVSTDSYVTRYRITYRNSATVITLASAPTAGTVSWRIKGYAKDQRWKMLSFSIRFQTQGTSQDSPGDEA